MAKKTSKLNLNIDFTVENGHSEYEGCLEIKNDVTQNCQILDDDDGERQFLAEAVEAFYRANPKTKDGQTFVYSHKTKAVTIK